MYRPVEQSRYGLSRIFLMVAAPHFFQQRSGLVGGQSIGGKGHHDLPQAELGGEILPDFLGLVPADAPDFGQAEGILLQDVQGLLPELLHDAHSGGGAERL